MLLQHLCCFAAIIAPLSPHEQRRSSSEFWPRSILRAPRKSSINLGSRAARSVPEMPERPEFSIVSSFLIKIPFSNEFNYF